MLLGWGDKSLVRICPERGEILPLHGVIGRQVMRIESGKN
jgi:hypothetical protein